MLQQIPYKISLIGESGSGKSTFIKNLLNIDVKFPTLGVNVFSHTINYNNNKYLLNIWDCAGDNRYLGLGKEYIKDSDYVLLFGQDSSFREWIPTNISFKSVSSSTVNLEEIIQEIIDNNEN